MGKIKAVRIERYCPAQQKQDAEVCFSDTHKIRDFYATKKDTAVAWPIFIPSSVDYLQIVTVETDSFELGSNTIFFDDTALDTASIYPDAYLYDTDEALEASQRNGSFFSDERKKELVEKFAAEKCECLVVTRSGNIRSFSKERDVVLSHAEDRDMWFNTTDTAGVLSYGIC